MQSSYISYNHTSSLFARSTFMYVQAAGHFLCDSGYFTKREGYDSFLLVYTLKGCGILNYGGSVYDLKAGQAFFIDCSERQEYHTGNGGPWEIKWVHFNGGTSRAYFNYVNENSGPVIDLNEGYRVESHLDGILELMKTRDLNFEIKAAPVLAQLLSELMLSVSADTSDLHNFSHEGIISNAVGYIEENYSREIGLADMSRAACLSKYHFIRVFKKVTGFSPYEYLIKYRITKAKDLLKSSREPVDKIACRVGSKSTSSFIKTFRELENTTPFKYRKFWNG